MLCWEPPLRVIFDLKRDRERGRAPTHGGKALALRDLVQPGYERPNVRKKIHIERRRFSDWVVDLKQPPRGSDDGLLLNEGVIAVRRVTDERRDRLRHCGPPCLRELTKRRISMSWARHICMTTYAAATPAVTNPSRESTSPCHLPNAPSTETTFL